MRRRLILHKTVFPRYTFFTSYLIDSRVFRVRRFVSELVEYACINTRKSMASIREKLHQKRNEHVASFQLSPAHHKTQFHTMKVYNTRPVSLTIEVYFLNHRSIYSLVPKQSTLSSSRIRGPTRSGKALHLVH